MNVIHFRSRDELRAWFQEHHAQKGELWVGYFKKASGQPSITWPESVDEALCVGWIDGIRKRVDDRSYTIRFTPRKPTSIWSAVNIRRVQVLTAENRMLPAGLKAFEARKENRSGIYSYEQRPEALPDPYDAVIRRNPAAWEFFQAQPPWYRRAATWWIISAKREPTRLKRLEALIEGSANARRIGPLNRPEPGKGR
jgi:uncharacterized protein YdeI (YjbR/CyaY-like superfamily)